MCEFVVICGVVIVRDLCGDFVVLYFDSVCEDCCYLFVVIDVWIGDYDVVILIGVM